LYNYLKYYLFLYLILVT